MELMKHFEAIRLQEKQALWCTNGGRASEDPGSCSSCDFWWHGTLAKVGSQLQMLQKENQKTYVFVYVYIWANNNLSRGHSKWWLSRGIFPK